MLAETVLSAQELRTLWHQLGQDDGLAEPYELTEHGEIVMSPRPTNRHQVVTKLIADQLQEHLGRLAVTEVAVMTTTAGIRVPDVVWMPMERWAPAGTEPVEAPALVVEVLSPGNRKAEVLHKVQAHLASGVQEVVVVGLDGSIDYHRPDGRHAQSARGLSLAVPADFTR